ncbi:chymotrypsinogen B-like [Hydractinia symbiolongicarpus]|uniref:chymotrypsinogen B-like n=1 Tax=Hydractinia symbiolongicarpus TaxID=13093 RepID=UPI00254D4C06|nr:chymotrypsinogen B-like [Hydractinia symbiolongicarpus]
MYEILIFILLSVLNLNQACVDIHPKICKDYVSNPRVNICNYPTHKKWMTEHCKKSCNLCHLYTTLPPTTLPPRTVPPMTGCGKTFIPKSRVIAGQDAVPGAWPWQVALHASGRFMCGGSLVAANWIVTAAHCVVGRQARHFTVVLGLHNRSHKALPDDTYQVTRVIVHSGYRYKSNDIAVLKLKRPVMMKNNIQRVCLPEQDQPPVDGTTCYITGWGKTKHPGGASTILQQAPLNTVNETACKKLNERLGIRITDSMLCAGNQISKKSGCHGDSGGPFVCQAQDGRWFLHGVVSWGSPQCKSKHSYSVFAKVSKLRSWLDLFIWQ